MVKADKPKVEGGSKTKVSCFQQSTSTQKESSKAPMTEFEDKVFNFGKQKSAVYFMKKCEANSKCIGINYKNSGTGMAMAIKKMETPMINVPGLPKDKTSRY